MRQHFAHKQRRRIVLLFPKRGAASNMLPWFELMLGPKRLMLGLASEPYLALIQTSLAHEPWKDQILPNSQTSLGVKLRHLKSKSSNRSCKTRKCQLRLRVFGSVDRTQDRSFCGLVSWPGRLQCQWCKAVWITRSLGLRNRMFCQRCKLAGRCWCSYRWFLNVRDIFRAKHQSLASSACTGVFEVRLWIGES